MNRLIFALFAAFALFACGKDAAGDRRRAEQEAAEDDASASAPRSATEGKGEILYYKHPMGLPDTSPVPKKDSMGMDYIPVYENDAEGAAGAIAIAPETIQTMGVRTAPVEMFNFGRTVRAYGAVEANTRLQTAIAARVEGWIDTLAVTAIGDEVKEGDLLFRLYSPDLIAAQQDFLVAVRSGSDGRIASASRRLVSLGLQEQTIGALRQRGSAEERAPVYAVHDGIVSALNVREGAFVKPGDQIAMLQDYSEVWVMTSIAEQDLGEINAGLPVDVDFPNVANARRRGTVDYVYPTVDPKTRTGRVRIVLANEDSILKPGAYADVSFTIGGRERIAAPSEAVLRDSRGAHVILALGDGRFAPRPVETGVVATGQTEIVAGLQEGDEVVVSGQFLIDSESSLRESFRKMTAPDATMADTDMKGEEMGGVKPDDESAGSDRREHDHDGGR